MPYITNSAEARTYGQTWQTSCQALGDRLGESLLLREVSEVAVADAIMYCMFIRVSFSQPRLPILADGEIRAARLELLARTPLTAIPGA